MDAWPRRSWTTLKGAPPTTTFVVNRCRKPSILTAFMTPARRRSRLTRRRALRKPIRLVGREAAATSCDKKIGPSPSIERPESSTYSLSALEIGRSSGTTRVFSRLPRRRTDASPASSRKTSPSLRPQISDTRRPVPRRRRIRRACRCVGELEPGRDWRPRHSETPEGGAEKPSGHATPVGPL
jgi:hypothetical protein